MANELPRIADATEKSAFADEENYFLLNTIAGKVTSTLLVNKLILSSNIRAGVQLRRMNDDLNTLIDMFKEQLETQKRLSLRTSNNANNNVSPSGSPSGGGTGGGRPSAPSSNVFSIFGGFGSKGKLLAVALGATLAAFTQLYKNIKFFLKPLNSL